MRRLWKHREQDQRPEYVSVLDLGASAAKALVVHRSGEQAAILGRGYAAHRRGIADDCTIGDSHALEAACEQALTQAEDATEAIHGTKVVPDAVSMSVPVTWVRGALGVGRARRLNLEEGIVAEECVEPIVRAGRQAIRHLGRVTGAGEWKLLDAVVVTFSVDGHRVTDPIGFRGHVLEAVAFVVAAPTRLLRALGRIADALQLEPPLLVAEPLALASVCPDDGLIIQVGAQTTGVILSRYGAPASLAGICQGGRTLTQALADALGVSVARADVVLRAYVSAKLADDDQAKIRELLQQPLSQWLSSVTGCLRSWTNVRGEWPPNIHLCGGSSVLNDLERLVATTSWLEIAPFPYTPQLRLWDGSNVAQVLDHTDRRWQVDGLTSLALAAWTLRDRGPASPDGILRASLEI